MRYIVYGSKQEYGGMKTLKRDQSYTSTKVDSL